MDFEGVIRQYVALGRPNQKGWCPTLCKVCNDHGRKGLRGGFNFSNGGIGYRCFNCEIVAAFHPNSVDMPSENLIRVCEAFGIPSEVISELQMLVIHNRTSGGGISRQVLDSARVSGPATLPTPPWFVKLTDLNEQEPIRQLAELHLHEDRAMTVNDYPFLIGMPNSDPSSKKWTNRLIIPVYDTHNNLIFYQGRDLIGRSSRKYISSETSRDRIVYGLDEVTKRTNAPLFITEGFFDAFHVGGCAVLGRDISKPVEDLLNNSTREKIIIPDRYGDGQDLAKVGIRNGWKVSVPDFGQCKDVTEAVVKYGKLFVIKTIMDSVYSGTAAETMVELYCK